MKPSIRLSQCMIVKNEEKNIRQALSWGKEIVFEQIVVDTGSTDSTVEIAEELGAKVYHFPWINDFSAAKNFAIEQARGNWIAFLDADEYFSEEDVKKIRPLLRDLEKNFYPLKRPHLVRSLLVNLMNGEMGTSVQDRIFRNLPNLRYHNRIHECLDLTDGGELYVYDATQYLAIFHTGYDSKVFEEKNKRERNMDMIRKELEENPDNAQMWQYLGDSLFSSNRLEETEHAYLQAIKNPASFGDASIKDPGFAPLLRVKTLRGVDSDDGVLEIYRQAKDCGCISPDVDYWVGEWFHNKGQEDQAIQCFEKSLQLMEQYKGIDTLVLSGRLLVVYQRIFRFFVKQNRSAEVVRYGILILRLEPYQWEVLNEILSLLKKEPGEEVTANATFGLLSKLYDLSSFKNKAFLIKVSERAEFPALKQHMYTLLNAEEREFLSKSGDIF